VLDVVNKAGGFTEEDVPVLSVFANQAAMAIEHARLQQQAEQLAVLAERERLARDLHDSVTQSLYSVTLYANAAALALAAGKGDVTAGYLQELKETAQEGMRDMRLLIFQLHPPVLETEGLVAALQARLAAVEDRAGLQTEFRIEGERRLPIAIESELYWIAQEALNNVRKHASARHVTVHLHFTLATVCLEVRDDGVGFDPQTVPAERRGGLRTIAERTARVGGKLTYESALGQGTRVMVEVPL
jgi:signal transduction histidine kinase